MGDTLELSKLYRQAAEQMGIVGDDDAAGFYLTQAFVFALEAGDPLADQLCRELKSLGRI